MLTNVSVPFGDIGSSNCLSFSASSMELQFPSPSGISVLLIIEGVITGTSGMVSVPFGDIGSSNFEYFEIYSLGDRFPSPSGISVLLIWISIR